MYSGYRHLKFSVSGGSAYTLWKPIRKILVQCINLAGIKITHTLIQLCVSEIIKVKMYFKVHKVHFRVSKVFLYEKSLFVSNKHTLCTIKHSFPCDFRLIAWKETSNHSFKQGGVTEGSTGIYSYKFEYWIGFIATHICFYDKYMGGNNIV